MSLGINAGVLKKNIETFSLPNVLSSSNEKVGDKTAIVLTKVTNNTVSPEKRTVNLVQGNSTNTEEYAIQSLNSFSGKGVKEVQRNTRKLFLDFIKMSCGLSTTDSLDKLPDNVQEAMKLKGNIFTRRSGDWAEGSARPLTLKRIKAIMTELNKFDMNEGSLFHAKSQFGNEYRAVWGKMPDAKQRNLLSNLSNVAPDLQQSLKGAWMMIGPDFQPRTLYLILNHAEEIKQLSQKNELTAENLFKTIYPGKNVPQKILDAQRMGDKRGIADGFVDYDRNTLNDTQNTLKNELITLKYDSKEIMEAIVKMQMRGILSARPYDEIAKQIKEEMADKDLLVPRFTPDDIAVKCNPGVLAGEAKSIGTVMATLGRQVNKNEANPINELVLSFKHGKEVSQMKIHQSLKMSQLKENDSSFEKKAKEIKEKNEKECSDALEDQINKFCAGNQAQKQKIYSALTSDDGMSKVIKAFGFAKYGFGIEGIYGLHHTFEKLDDGVLQITSQSHSGQIEEFKEKGKFKVDYMLKMKLYPDGRQEIVEHRENLEKIDENAEKEKLPGYYPYFGGVANVAGEGEKMVESKDYFLSIH